MITALKNHIRTHTRVYLISIVVFEAIIVVALGITIIFLYNIYTQAHMTRIQALKSLSSWEKLFTKYPNYPEVYYNAAFYAARVGDREKAVVYIQKSLRLNPNFGPSLKLEKEL